MWKQVKSGQPWHEKVRKKKKNGETYLAMVTFSLIMDDKGNVLNTVILQLDLSEHERLEHQLQQAQKMEAIGTLVGGIAHDFNNMLAGMVGNLYLAKKQLVEQPTVLQKLNNVEQLSYKASEMISQLLTFARKGHISTQPMRMNKFFDETLSLFRAAIPENIEVIQEVDKCDLCIDGDATQLHQVLMNLISNAQDALEGVANPKIHLKLSEFFPNASFLTDKPYFKKQRYALLSVRDNGQGIAQDVMDVLFEPFFTTKEQGKGTGLGLSMVFGAVKTHQGYIEVESEEGKGTAFNVYLPTIDSKRCLKEVVQPTPIPHGRGEMILLVDDEEHIIETNKEVLESLGYQIMVASDGLEAVEAYKQHYAHISLVMIDVVMPKLGGIAAVEKMQKINPDIKVIYSTGYDNTSTLSDMGSLKGEQVLSKPYRIDMLADAVEKILRH